MTVGKFGPPKKPKAMPKVVKSTTKAKKKKK